MEGVAEGVFRVGLDVPRALSGVGRGGDLLDGVRAVPALLRRLPGGGLEVVQPRHRDGEGAKRGDHTGPNPTDRGKRGVKRHVLTDARGVPVAVKITAANVHDKWMVGATLDAVPLRVGRGVRRPEHLCLDKGYDYVEPEAEARERRITPHIRRRGEQPLLGCVRGKPRRWVVERTNSWHNRFRALLIRWERKADNYLALLYLASALIAIQQA